MKSRRILLLPAIFLISCGQQNVVIDDVDLAYYVHHITHNVFRNSKAAEVTIKQLDSNKEEKYIFESLVWSDTYYWTSTIECQDYVKNEKPFGYVFVETSFLHEEISNGFINNNYWDCVSAKDYYGENNPERMEESNFAGRVAKKNGDNLTLITQWNVISYLNKTPIYGDDEDGDIYGYEYEDPLGLICVSRSVYHGELLSKYELIISQKAYIRDDDSDGVAEYHNEVFDSPLDYLFYEVKFR